MSKAPGFTMLEVIVVLAIIGLLTTIVGFAVLSTTWRPPRDESVARVGEARREAIRRGIAITIVVAPPRRATAFPDGSVVADTSIGMSRLQGRPVARRTTGTAP